jgi:predicted short-subunit dehydrogenase-like oxidoreductase (DUF2520 family)
MRVVVLGAGKLARHLGPACAKNGIEVVAVYNRHLEAARLLVETIGTTAIATDQLADLPPDADLYVMTVSDQAIGPLAEQLSLVLKADLPIVHTSGATPAAILSKATRRFGVFYPFQTFSPGRQVDFSHIPLCIYATEPALLRKLRACAKKLSQQVYQLDDEQRAQLHLAGVFANNFVNHLVGQSHQLLAEADIPRPIIFNLVRETIEKLEQQEAASAQTGPAIRGDEMTIDKHLALLADSPGAKAIYELITQQITNSTNQ